VQRPQQHFRARLPPLGSRNYFPNQPNGSPEIKLALDPPLVLLNLDRVPARLSANPKYPTQPISVLSSRLCRASLTSSPQLTVLAGQCPLYLDIKRSHDNATIPGLYLISPLHTHNLEQTVYPPLQPKRRTVRLTLVIYAASHTSHGPALPKNLASLAPRHLRLPWRTTFRRGYNSIVPAALATRPLHPSRNSSTHFPLSTLPVPQPNYPLPHPRQYL